MRSVSWERTPDEKSLQATSENKHRRCGRDVLGQTVPSTGSSNRKGQIVNSGQPCVTDIQHQEEERRRLRVPKSAVCSSSSARCDGAVPCRHLCTRTASLNSIRSGALSQCNWWRSRVMWSYLDEENTSHAAEFMNDWSCWRRYDGMPVRVALP